MVKVAEKKVSLLRKCQQTFSLVFVLYFYVLRELDQVFRTL
jgi:hypothetical protein